MSCPSCERALVLGFGGAGVLVFVHEPVLSAAGAGVAPSCDWWQHAGEGWIAGVLVGEIDPTVAL